LGRVSAVVDLYVPLQFIIGDVEGGDQLCSRWSYRQRPCKRMCRTCDVSTANSSDTTLYCNRIKVADIVKLYEAKDYKALKAISQRPYYNCLYDIDCGKDPYGVFSMIHTEALHALETGLIQRMVEVLFEDLKSDTLRAELDIMVKKLTSHPTQHGYKNFPRLRWTDGVSKLTMLTGDQRVGKMFAILLVALTREGEIFFCHHLQHGRLSWSRLVYCFQQMLCYWAWLKQDYFWMVDDEAACRQMEESIRIMLRQIQNLWPREAGLEWLLTKFHEQFHVPRDIHRNGKHANVHTGPQEHNHIPIKKAAKRTQLQKHKFDLQTGERIADRLVLQRAFDRVSQAVQALDKEEELRLQREAEDPNGVFEDLTQCHDGLVRNATKGKVLMHRLMTDNDNFNKRNKYDIGGCVQWNNSRSGKERTERILHQTFLLEFLIQEFFESDGKVTVDESGTSYKYLELPCFTEYQRDDTVYRCHPKYRGENAYYDWCHIKWWDGEDPITNQPKEIRLIGRIHLFVETPDGTVKAVVQSVEFGTDEPYGVFGTYWCLEQAGPARAKKPKFALADVEALDDHVMVLPYDDGGQRYIHIHDRSEWPDYFQETVPPQE
jgi:hypothetical protein